MSNTYELNEIITTEFYNKMKNIDNFLNKQKLLSQNLFKVCLLSSFILSLIIFIFIHIFSNDTVLSIENIIPTLIVLSIICFPILTIIFTILAFADPVSVNVINYDENKIQLSLKNSYFPLSSINNDFKIIIDNSNNLDNTALSFIQNGLKRGYFYNYEVTIIENIEKINKKV